MYTCFLKLKKKVCFLTFSPRASIQRVPHMEFNRYRSGVLWADDAVAWIHKDWLGGKVHSSLYNNGTENPVEHIQ